MIVNISSTHSANLCCNDALTFSENKNWDFSVRNFVGVFQDSIKSSGIFVLYTNMIEQDDGNLPRAICYIHLEGGSSYVNYSPTQPLRYKLRFHDMSQTLFTFRSLGSNREIIFKEAAFQIEITETYGRF